MKDVTAKEQYIQLLKRINLIELDIRDFSLSEIAQIKLAIEYMLAILGVKQ